VLNSIQHPTSSNSPTQNPKSKIKNPKLKHPMISWKRTLRTASSERFLAQREGKDVAAVDLHYLASGTVAGTVILLKDAGWKESDVPALLGSLDEDFLPDVDLDHGNLNYTVVLGEVLGNYEAQLLDIKK
jgi:hypothetical protein